jgi:hypothetical protein
VASVGVDAALHWDGLAAVAARRPFLFACESGLPDQAREFKRRRRSLGQLDSPPEAGRGFGYLTVPEHGRKPELNPVLRESDSDGVLDLSVGGDLDNSVVER